MSQKFLCRKFLCLILGCQIETDSISKCILNWFSELGSKRCFLARELPIILKFPVYSFIFPVLVSFFRIFCSFPWPKILRFRLAEKVTFWCVRIDMQQWIGKLPASDSYFILTPSCKQNRKFLEGQLSPYREKSWQERFSLWHNLVLNFVIWSFLQFFYKQNLRNTVIYNRGSKTQIFYQNVILRRISNFDSKFRK